METKSGADKPPQTTRSNAAARYDRIVLPKLLAPAGDWDCVKAAVENGADAVYFGLDHFNARMRADNFTEADLPKLMSFLHRRGVEGYVTLNTLVFESELADAERYLRTMMAAGADAVIVQDVGLCRMVRALSPDFPIHASTQMTLTSAAGVNFAKALGCQRVVLARELSIQEIDQIQSALRTSQSALPLEVFVHGALCVAYSGQCLTSESLGGRSANRGECAQACRMPYALIADGQRVPLGDRRYLLSPQDLAGIEVLPDLVRTGVASLKIEGRLKAPEYVANITRIYREALDQLGTRNEKPRIDRQHASRPFTPRPVLGARRYEMEMAFSRGLYTGWFRGVNNRELVHARFGKKRGVYLGEVTSVHRESVTVRLQGPLEPGDGVVFDAGRPDEIEEGGRVYELRTAARGLREAAKRRIRTAGPAGRKGPRGSDASGETREQSTTELLFGRGDINFSRIHVGDKLWKTSDPALERQWRLSFQGEKPRFQRPVTMEVHGLLGSPLTILLRDEQGHIVSATSSVPLTQAERHPLTAERLRQQLGRLGGTPFKLGTLENRLEGRLMLPVSELNRLRRELVVVLERQRAEPRRWTLNGGRASTRLSREATPRIRTPRTNPLDANPQEVVRRPEAHSPPGPDRPNLRAGAESEDRHDACPTLIILVRTLAQLETALHCGAQTVYCDFENPRKYRDAVATFRGWKAATRQGVEKRDESAFPVPHSALYVAPPRIFKPGDEWQLEQIRSCAADGYLVRNYDHLRFFADERRVGDFSLNVANHLTADYFLDGFDLERVTASYDLNVQQLEALLQQVPPERIEITLHQHMPMFHMEHCVFCAFLSSGTDYRDCGRPCDKHEVKLRDRVGAEHPVKADVGCRNTVFNALAQTGAEHVQRMIALGARHFRIEFLNETSDEVQRTITKYRQLLRGELSGTQLWKELKLFNQLGVTRGR